MREIAVADADFCDFLKRNQLTRAAAEVSRRLRCIQDYVAKTDALISLTVALACVGYEASMGEAGSSKKMT